MTKDAVREIVKGVLPVMNQEMLFRIFSSAPAILGVVRDDDYVIEFANPYFEQFLGKEKVLQQRLADVLQLKSPHDFYTVLRKVMRTGKSYVAYEVEFVRQTQNDQNTVQYYDVNIQRYRGTNRQTENWLILFLYDVTEKVLIRQKHEETTNALEKNQKFLNDFFNNAPAFIGTASGKDLVISNVNPEMEKLFTGRKLLHEKVADAIPELKNNGMLARLRQVFQEGTPLLGTEQLLKVKKPGNKRYTFRYITYSCQPTYQPSGAIDGVLVFGYDVTRIVTEKKKQLNNVKKIMETLPQITSISSPRGTNIYFNRFFYEYSGLSKKEAAVNGWNSILHPASAPAILERWSASLQRNTEYKDEIKLLRHSDQTYRWHKVTIQPVRNSAGEVVNWVASAVDIQDEKEKVEKKDEFISIASHELKTPLTTVKAYLQLIEADSITTPQVDIYAKKALASTERLNELISELLEVSRLQQENFMLDRVPFDFDQMIRSAVSDNQHQVPHKIIIEGETRLFYNGDRERLKQVVSNLVGNAIKYSPGKSEVKVTLAVKSEGILVCVRDYGIGIAPVHAERIFDRYYRVNGSQVSFQGLGIGLYISMQIVLRHEGKLWVESEPNKGSSFYILLPNKQ